MLAKTESVALIGADARLVQVEVHVGPGLPGFRIVGLPAKSVREAEQRTRSALEATDLKWPQRRIIANLAPGALPKEGTHFDLGLALGVLAADQKIPSEPLTQWVIVGELALDGCIRPVRGVLAAAMAVRGGGRRGLICPAANASEAALVQGIEVIPVSTLAESIDFVKGKLIPAPPVASAPVDAAPKSEDMADVRGQVEAKEALEVAAAGGHNLLMVGPPGAGKTMLARRLPGILPPMTQDESLEVTRIYSVAGLLPERAALMVARPLRNPHHHISLAGLIGGGSGLARPGEIALANHGVLFLDEFTQFRGDVLESLRAPIEEGRVRISRSAGVVTFPCRFSLIAAMNPCACGYEGDRQRVCTCSALQLQTYGRKLSGPLMDRFDMQASVPRLSREELLGKRDGESSREILDRVVAAREKQSARFGPGATNASVDQRLLRQHLDLGADSLRFLGRSIESAQLSGRGFVRTLRVARTLADLVGSVRVELEHVVKALDLRFLDQRAEVIA